MLFTLLFVVYLAVAIYGYVLLFEWAWDRWVQPRIEARIAKNLQNFLDQYDNENADSDD